MTQPVIQSDAERARKLLFDTATDKSGWELPEPKAAFSADTAVAAMLTFTADLRASLDEALARVGVLEEALEEVKLICWEEPYKVVDGQKPCKHTAAINEIYGLIDAALPIEGASNGG